MPLEVGHASSIPVAGSVGAAWLVECRHTLEASLAKVEHCLRQLPEEDLHWRPHESHNSIQNVILHLCGNLRQWIIHGVGNAPDHRHRADEFADRTRRSRDELLTMLQEAVAQCVRTLAACPEGRLLEPRTIQGFDTTVLGALFDSVSHFVGHTHEIVYITRLRLGDAYRFQWTPTPEQGG